MDSSADKSLPGMSMPKWMRKGAGSDRYDYLDYCASPPGDGFFHMKYRQQQGSNTGQSAVGDAVPCYANSIKADTSATEIAANLSKIVMDSQKIIKPPTDLNLQNYGSSGYCESLSSDKSIIFKTVASSTLVTKAIPDGTQSMPASPKTSRAKFYASSSECLKEHEATTTAFMKETRLVSRSSDLGCNNFPSVIITRPEEDGSLSAVDESSRKIHTVSVAIKSAPCSPLATPATTPLSSPQVGRKSGNPFFTGSNASGSGSFLFRSPPNQEQSNGNRDGGRSFYETKVDVQVNPVTKSVSKSVRYVPRPSELRELNFWSPTSM